MTQLTKASELKPGDLVDLQDDRYADPQGEHTEFECKYLMVETVEHETPNCVAIWFDGFDCVGFPPEHLLKVESNDHVPPHR